MVTCFKTSPSGPVRSAPSTSPWVNRSCRRRSSARRWRLWPRRSRPPTSSAPIPETEYAASLARLYHVVNVAHPFREGNGRTQREFITALAAESGHTVDWTRVTGYVNDVASHRARQGDLGPLIGMFQTVVDKRAPTALPPSVGAAFPGRAIQATGYAAGQSQPSTPYRGPLPGKGAEPER